MAIAAARMPTRARGRGTRTAPMPRALAMGLADGPRLKMTIILAHTSGGRPMIGAHLGARKQISTRPSAALRCRRTRAHLTRSSRCKSRRRRRHHRHCLPRRPLCHLRRFRRRPRCPPRRRPPALRRCHRAFPTCFSTSPSSTARRAPRAATGRRVGTSRCRTMRRRGWR